MKQKQLKELVQLISRSVLKEYSMLSAASSNDKTKVFDPQTDSDPTTDIMKPSEKAKASRDQRHDIEQKLKDTEFKRKAELADKERNQLKVKQYDRSIKPAIKREQDQLNTQLRQIK